MSFSLMSAVVGLCAEVAIAASAATSVATGTAAPVAASALEVAAPAAPPALAPEPANDAGPDAPAAFSPAFADRTDAEVVDAVLGAIDGLDTLSARFIQVAPSGAVSRGDLQLRRPNRLRFAYDPPSPLLIVATQGNVYVRDNELETTDFYPIKKTPLRFLLGKRVELGDAEIVAVDRGEDLVAVTFASQDEDAPGELTLVLGSPGLDLRQWIIRDAQDGVTVVTLEDVTLGAALSNRLFEIPDSGGTFLKN